MKQRLAGLLATAGLVAGMAFVSVGVPVALAADPEAPATSSTATSTGPDSLGTDFWLAFPGNFDTPTLTLFITGPTATAVTVAAPGVPFSTTFPVTPGTVTAVGVPSVLDIHSSDAVENLGIHVTAAAEVTVYGLNRLATSSDAYLGLPTDVLGMDYIVEGYQNVDVVNGTEFAVVATQDGTTVWITPTALTNSHPAGTPYMIVLNQGQTYQLRNSVLATADLSGSTVTSDKPIAVFGGHRCANIPSSDFIACDHVVEQMTPTNRWGTAFVTEPLAARVHGDTFRYLAGTDGTTVQVNGVTVATLGRGQFFQQVLTAASTIGSNNPILVTQYANSATFDLPDPMNGDPFEVIVPPSEQFLSGYTVAIPALGFPSNFINVLAPTASLADVKLDGVVVPGTSFTAIPGSTFSAAQLAVSVGSHTLTGSQPLGATVYGFDVGNSYGYPAGFSFAGVPVATTLTLSPEEATDQVGTEHCVTATVLDQNDAPMPGVGVDFTVTGVNPASDSVSTAADGTAQFCYSGSIVGDDSILAAAGTISDTAIEHWTAVSRTISALGDVHGWLTLKNSDDQGTKFDLRVELLKNGSPVATGIQRCINGVGRNPTLAKEAIVPWNAFSPIPVSSGDVLALRVSARIGTGWGGVPCNGHGSAIGVRFYYDAAGRASQFAATISPDPSVNLYLHSNGSACNNSESSGVTSRWLNTTAPWAALPGKCKDSGAVNVGGGNPWQTISTWTLAAPPTGAPAHG